MHNKLDSEAYDRLDGTQLELWLVPLQINATKALHTLGVINKQNDNFASWVVNESIKNEL